MLKGKTSWDCHTSQTNTTEYHCHTSWWHSSFVFPRSCQPKLSIPRDSSGFIHMDVQVVFHYTWRAPQMHSHGTIFWCVEATILICVIKRVRNYIKQTTSPHQWYGAIIKFLTEIIPQEMWFQALAKHSETSPWAVHLCQKSPPRP